MQTYKYLGVHLNDRLDWANNTDALYQKGLSRQQRYIKNLSICTDNDICAAIKSFTKILLQKNILYLQYVNNP